MENAPTMEKLGREVRLLKVYAIAATLLCAVMFSFLYTRGSTTHAFEEIDVGREPHLVPELLKLTGRVRVVPVLVSGTRIEVAPRGGTRF